MLVVFGKETADKLKDRMTILELDTFMQPGLEEPVTAYAVIEVQDIPLQDLPQLENMTLLHNTMWVEYRARRFNFCEQAMEHLRGKWKGTLDSFYEEFSTRIQILKGTKLDENWSGIIYKNVPDELVK
jgi:hypothetical protein